MGTRADFYIGRGEQAEWLGSIAWDGNPDGVFDGTTGLFDQPWTEEGWRVFLAAFFGERDDSTLPEQGWPWPWDDSRTTDYAYALDDGAIWSSCFGGEWFRVDPAADEYGYPEGDDCGRTPTAVFPDMAARRAMARGARSGAITISAGGVE